MEKHRRASAESLKKLSAPKKLRAALLLASVTLLTLSIVIFILQWREGKAATQSAQILLRASGIRPQINALSAKQSFIESGENESVMPIETKFKGFDVIARLDITQLDLCLPVLSETSNKALKVSVCRYLVERPNGEFNLVITGHNYRNGALFGNLNKVKVGTEVFLTEKSGKTLAYTVYAIEHIKPNQIDRLTDEKYADDLSLLTCEKGGNSRLLVRCRPLYCETSRP